MKNVLMYVMVIMLGVMNVFGQKMSEEPRTQWGWITPGETTKATVEKTLGESIEKDKRNPYQTYSASFGKVNILYSTNNKYLECGQIVPKDTVIDYFVSPAQPTLLTQLPYDLATFKRNPVFAPREITYLSPDHSLVIDASTMVLTGGQSVEVVRVLIYQIPCEKEANRIK